MKNYRETLKLIEPSWPAIKKVKAYTTTRHGGVSPTPYDSLNLAKHSGDASENIDKNRALLAHALRLPNEPFWLSQVHGNHVVPAQSHPTYISADAAFTFEPNIVCTVLTADCLPILLCDQSANWVAAIHAGWKGILAGVIEATLKQVSVSENKILAWLGPAIGPNAFEVGEEVRQQFIAIDPTSSTAFKPYKQDRWLANIYQLANQRLSSCGITQIYGGELCTYSNPSDFFSYRRDKQHTGRMASLIWLEEPYGKGD